MAKSRERGTGSVYLREDPNSPGQKPQTWWISYYVDGKRKRESSGTRKKSDAQALLKRRMGEHALGLELGEEAKRLTFEDLEGGGAWGGAPSTLPRWRAAGSLPLVPTAPYF